MSGAWVNLLSATLVALLLAGCQGNTVRDSSSDGATGNLGSPTQHQGPADIYIELSAAYLRDNQLAEAYKNAKKAVLVDPSSSNAHYVFALVNQRLGQRGEAEQEYRKSVSLDPRNPVALNALGSFLCEQKNFEEADEYFHRALANPLYSTPWLAWHNAGHCREMAGDPKGAESDYRAALQVNPRFAPSLIGMAKMTFEERNYLSTRGYLQRFGEVAPHTAESLWLGVRTENQLGDRDQMASYALKLRSKFPDSDEAKYLQTIE